MRAMNPAKPKQVMSHPMPRQLYYELQLLVGIDQCMVGRASYQTGSKRITSVFWLCAPTPSYSTCSSPLELFTLPMASLRSIKESNVIGLRFQDAILQVSRLEYGHNLFFFFFQYPLILLGLGLRFTRFSVDLAQTCCCSRSTTCTECSYSWIGTLSAEIEAYKQVVLIE